MRRRLALVVTLACWYGAATMSTMVNKLLMSNPKKVVGSLTLASINTAVAAICDVIVVRFWLYRRPIREVVRRSQIVELFPIACAMFMAKNLSMVAYEYIPLSLSHTIKSTLPAFTVMLSAIWFGNLPSCRVFVSLVPILVGAALTASSDLSFNYVGLFACVVSNFLSAFQSIYMKRVVVLSSYARPGGDASASSGGKDEGRVGHAVVDDGGDSRHLPRIETGHSSSSSSSSSAGSGDHINGVLSRMILVHLIVASMGCVLGAPVAIVHEVQRQHATQQAIPYAQIIGGSIIQWGGSVSAYAFLACVEPLSYSVAKIVQRILLIIVSILFFRNHISFWNGAGIFLAAAGVTLYIMAKHKGAQPRMKGSPTPSPRAAGDGGKPRHYHHEKQQQHHTVVEMGPFGTQTTMRNTGSGTLASV